MKKEHKELESIADVWIAIEDNKSEGLLVLRCLNCDTVGFPAHPKPIWTGIQPLPKQKDYKIYSHGYCPPCGEIAIADMHDYYDNIDKR